MKANLKKGSKPDRQTDPANILIHCYLVPLFTYNPIPHGYCMYIPQSSAQSPGFSVPRAHYLFIYFCTENWTLKSLTQKKKIYNFNQLPISKHSQWLCKYCSLLSLYRMTLEIGVSFLGSDDPMIPPNDYELQTWMYQEICMFPSFSQQIDTNIYKLMDGQLVVYGLPNSSEHWILKHTGFPYQGTI